LRSEEGLETDEDAAETEGMMDPRVPAADAEIVKLKTRVRAQDQDISQLLLRIEELEHENGSLRATLTHCRQALERSHREEFLPPCELKSMERGVYEELVDDGKRIERKPTNELRLVLRQPFKGEVIEGHKYELRVIPVWVRRECRKGVPGCKCAVGFKPGAVPGLPGTRAAGFVLRVPAKGRVMDTDQCSKCQGCGCPACLGFGWDCRKHVAEFGRIHGCAGLTPETVPTLTVEKQRAVKKHCLAMRDFDALHG